MLDYCFWNNLVDISVLRNSWTELCVLGSMESTDKQCSVCSTRNHRSIPYFLLFARFCNLTLSRREFILSRKCFFIFYSQIKLILLLALNTDLKMYPAQWSSNKGFLSREVVAHLVIQITLGDFCYLSVTLQSTLSPEYCDLFPVTSCEKSQV